MGKGKLVILDQYRKDPTDPSQILYLSIKNEEEVAKALEARRLQDEFGQQDTLGDKILRIVYIKMFCALVALVLSFIYIASMTFLGFNGLPNSIHVIFWAIIFYYAGSFLVKDELWYAWPIWFGVLCIFIATFYYIA